MSGSDESIDRVEATGAPRRRACLQVEEEEIMRAGASRGGWCGAVWAGLLWAGLAGLVGCSKSLTGSGYLGTYIDMKPNRYLQAESHLPWLAIDERTTLVIQPVRPYLRAGTRPVFFGRLAESFQAAFTREIRRAGLFANVTQNRHLMMPGGVNWVLDAVITEIDTGLPESSLDPGVTFRGARRIGVEGKISQMETGRTLLKFKDTRVGLPRRGLGLTRTDVENDLVRDLDAIARGVADTLQQIRAESQQVPEAEAVRR